MRCPQVVAVDIVQRIGTPTMTGMVTLAVGRRLVTVRDMAVTAGEETARPSRLPHRFRWRGRLAHGGPVAAKVHCEGGS